MERIHFHKQGNPERPTLLLLHGTGGTEHDLVPMAVRLDPGATIVSLRGAVIENGQYRHFKRLAPGVFDEIDLRKQTDNLETFLDEASQRYGFDRKKIVAFGYSNGANLVASHVFRYPNSLMGALLLHPLSAGPIESHPGLLGFPVFIGAGRDDPLCPVPLTVKLEQQLVTAGAHVETGWFDNGHRLSNEELNAASAWYKRHF